MTLVPVTLPGEPREHILECLGVKALVSVPTSLLPGALSDLHLGADFSKGGKNAFPVVEVPRDWLQGG